MRTLQQVRLALTFPNSNLLAFLLCVFALLPDTSLWAEPTVGDTIEVIDLRHRAAEEIVPLVKPLVGTGGAVTGRGSQLLVRTSTAELAQIKAIITQLDRAPAQLLITVEQSSDLALTRRDTDLPENAHVRVHGTERQDEATLRHSVRVMEGHEAFIATGQDVPAAASAPIMYGSGLRGTGSVDYRSVRSGFLVLPRINGELVTLTLTPQQMQLHPDRGGAIDIQSASTTLSGKLGEWIEFGAVENGKQVSENVILRSTARERGARQRLRFQVILIEP